MFLTFKPPSVFHGPWLPSVVSTRLFFFNLALTFVKSLILSKDDFLVNPGGLGLRLVSSLSLSKEDFRVRPGLLDGSIFFLIFLSLGPNLPCASRLSRYSFRLDFFSWISEHESFLSMALRLSKMSTSCSLDICLVLTASTQKRTPPALFRTFSCSYQYSSRIQEEQLNY